MMTYGGIGDNAPRVRKLRTGYGRTACFTLGPLARRMFSGDKEIFDIVTFVLPPFLKTTVTWGFSMNGENCLPVLPGGLPYQIALIWVFSEQDLTFQ